MFQSVLTGDYEHFYSKDPAFDVESKDYDHAKWIETKNDKYLPLKNGVTPVKFRLRRLSSKQRRYLFDLQIAQGPNVMAWWAIAMSLAAVDPLIVEGKTVELRQVQDNGWSRTSDEVMELVESVDDTALFWELVSRVQEATFTSPRD